jgi:lipopolysaccharide biosynthesis regulator YciM
VAAHYLCELAALAIERGAIDAARSLLRQAREETSPFPRAAVLRAQIAERAGDLGLAERLLRAALAESPNLLQEELPHLSRLVGAERRDALLAELAAAAQVRDIGELRQLVFAAVAAGMAQAAPLRAAIETVFAKDETLRAVWQAGDARFERIVEEIGALLAHAERYRCSECGFSGRSFYWHCPACQSWETFETYAVVKLR